MRWVLAPWEPVPASGFPARRCALAGLIEQRPGGPEPWSELELRDGSGTIALVTEGADVALAARGIDALPDLPLMGRLADAAPSDRAMLLDLLRQVGLTAGEIREALGADTGAARMLAVIDALTATRPRPVIDDHGEIRPGEERAPRPKPIPGTAAGGAYGDWLTLVDDCARADQGPPPGPGWAQLVDTTNQLRLESNLIRPDTTGNCTNRWDTATDDADSEVAAELSAITTGSFDYCGVYLRCRQPGASTADGYFAGIRNNGANLDYYRMDNGGYTQLGASIGSAGFAPGDRLGLNITGTTLDARRYRSGAWGSALGTRNDSTYTAAGYPALYLQPDGRVSAFYAGPYPSHHTPTDFGLLDTFDGTGGPPAGPGWRNQGHWGDPTGFVRTSGQMAASGGGWRADSWATAYPRSGAVAFGITLATVGSGDVYYFLFADHTSMKGYALRISGSTWDIGVFDGSFDDLDSVSQALSNGDGVCLIADDDGHVTAWHRSGGVWTKKLDVTDTTYTGSLYPGISAANTTARWDDMFGGNPTGGGPAPAVVPTRTLLGVGS